jgi:hypothetical protein
VLSKRVVVKDGRVRGTATRYACADSHKGIKVRNREGLHLLVKLLNKLEPVIETNLEDFSIIDLRYPNKIVVTVDKKISVREFLNKLFRAC